MRTLCTFVFSVLILTTGLTANAQKAVRVKTKHKVVAKHDTTAPPNEGDFVDLSKEPQPIEPIERLIHYPTLARDLGLEGKVVLDALISKSGSVEKVNILKSSNPIFDSAAVDAMRQAVFTPAEGAEHQPMRVWISRTINFKLSRGH